MAAFEPVVGAASDAGVTLAEQLFSVVDVLDGSGSLRRALTDPARPGTDKTALVLDLFGTLDSRVTTVVSDLVSQRWSAEADLVESIEFAGVTALLAYAQAQDELEAVESELFAVERAVSAERDLLTALSNRSATAEVRVALLDQVLGSKLLPATEAIVTRLVAAPRNTRLVPALQEIVRHAAQRRSRVVARVTAAVELSAQQRSRLAGILEGAYGTPVQLNVAVDPRVMGGIKVEVGAEVVDATVLTRLDEARRRLVS